MHREIAEREEAEKRKEIEMKKEIVKKVLLIISFILLANCSTKTKSHMSSVVGGTAGYGTCHHMLNTGVGLTAACTVVGAMDRMRVCFLMMI